MKSKLPHVGTTIFTVMSKMAETYNAVNLSQGFPTFETPKELVYSLDKAIRNGLNQYAPMAGLISLREAIAYKVESFQGINYDVDSEITVTSGATEAIFAAISAVVSQGDEVIVIEPSYDSYVPAILLNGGVPVYVSTSSPSYKVDWQLVNSKLTERTRLIIINTPHNPAGTTFKKEDIDELANIIAHREIYVLSDEVYEHIVFDEKKHISVATNPILKERTFVVSSFGKTYHITGWKVGYCLAPKELSNEFRKVHQYLTFSTFTAAQFAIAEFLKQSDFHEQLSSFYQVKRDKFIRGLDGSRFTINQSEGTFFQSLGYQAITNEKDVAVAELLVKSYGIASIPVSSFYHNQQDDQILRFCFAKDDETLEKGIERLLRFSESV